MYKNYEKRVKDFITDMSITSNQIIINDVTEQIPNIRQELLNNKIPKPFIFKGYTTEKDRINDTVKNNRFLYNMPDYPEKYQKKSRILETYSPTKFNFNLPLDKNLNNKTLENNVSNTALSLDLGHSGGGSTISRDKKQRYIRYIRKISIAEKKQMQSIIKKDSILQPEMKFKPRTDLERIYDEIKKVNLDENLKKIIERQLKNIKLYNYKKPKDLIKLTKLSDYYNLDLGDDMELASFYQNPGLNLRNKSLKLKSIYGPANIYYEARNNDKKLWARKENLNTEARGLLSSYHIKTHFKALEEIAECNMDKNKLKNTCFLLPHLLPKNIKLQKLKKLNESEKNKNTIIDYNNLENSSRLFNFEEDHHKDEKFEKDQEIDWLQTNNPNLMKKKNIMNPGTLKVLSSMAFNKTKSEDSKKKKDNPIKSKKNNNEEKNNPSNPTLINNMAKKILNDCKVYVRKSKFNNSSLKAKSGKTMITNGMSIEDFENKYNV